MVPALSERKKETKKQDEEVNSSGKGKGWEDTTGKPQEREDCLGVLKIDDPRRGKKKAKTWGERAAVAKLPLKQSDYQNHKGQASNGGGEKKRKMKMRPEKNAEKLCQVLY